MTQSVLDIGLPDVPCETPRRIAAVRGLAGAAARIYAMLRDAPRGLTCDEVERGMPDLPHQTVSARIRELELAGVLEKNGNRRATRKGRGAAVYLVPDGLLDISPVERDDPTLLPVMPQRIPTRRESLIEAGSTVITNGIRRGDTAAEIAARVVDLLESKRG